MKSTTRLFFFLVLIGLDTASFGQGFTGHATNPITYLTRFNDEIGIGTTLPEARLHVADGQFQVGRIGEPMYMQLSANDLKFHRAGRSYISQMNTQGDLAFTIGGSQNIKMIINSDGYVGIGTGYPKGVLQVGGYRPIIMQQTGGEGVYGSSIGFNARLNTEITPNQFIKEGGTIQEGGVVMTSDYWGNLHFQMYDGAGDEAQSIIDYEPDITFTNEGQVGIGTTEPGSFMLAVEGKVGAREVEVTLTSPWPDYVFKDDYQLRDLEEVASFIAEHKHLPEVPSEKTIAEEGHKLGEMNAILLKKVEELTLYLIDQNKRIAELEEQLSSK